MKIFKSFSDTSKNNFLLSYILNKMFILSKSSTITSPLCVNIHTVYNTALFRVFLGVFLTWIFVVLRMRQDDIILTFQRLRRGMRGWILAEDHIFSKSFLWGQSSTFWFCFVFVSHICSYHLLYALKHLAVSIILLWLKVKLLTQFT